MATDQIPTVDIKKIHGMGVMEKGKELGLEVTLDGTPMPLTLVFQTAVLSAFLPFLIQTVSRAQNEAGERADKGFFVAREGKVSWDSGEQIELLLVMEPESEFRIRINRNGARALMDALHEVLEGSLKTGAPH